MANIDILKIGNKTSLPNNHNTKFETLEDYLRMARQMIAAYAPKVRAGLAQEMLRNDDAVTNIAHALMIADWKYDNRGTIYGYRRQMVMYAIYSYVERSSKFQKKRMYSLDKALYSSSDSSQTFASEVEAVNTLTPEKDYETKEKLRIIKEKINHILTCGILTDKQSEYIRLYFLEDIPASKIAKDNKVSRQNVYDMIYRGLNEMKIFATQDGVLAEYAYDN